MNSEQFYQEVKKLRKLQRESKRYYHDDKLKRECATQEEIIDKEITRVEGILSSRSQTKLF